MSPELNPPLVTAARSVTDGSLTDTPVSVMLPVLATSIVIGVPKIQKELAHGQADKVPSKAGVEGEVRRTTNVR